MHSTTETAAPSLDFATAVEAAKLQALYHFAYGLSHEINNPLANIATRAQTLLVDEKDPQRRRTLATIVQQAFRGHEMIADLMLFARPPAPRLEEVDLARLADTVVGEMQVQADEQQTQLIRSGEGGPLMATVDPTQIAVALKALVQNSLEAMRNGGCVEISAERGTRNSKRSLLRTSLARPPQLRAPHSALRASSSASSIPAPAFRPISARISLIRSFRAAKRAAGWAWGFPRRGAFWSCMAAPSNSLMSRSTE